MSEVRIAVEWMFKEIINYYKFLDFKKNLKVKLIAVGKMYKCVLYCKIVDPVSIGIK